MSVVVSAYQLQKSYGARTLFRGLTFAIESGQRIGLIGPNGAGKSTLLKILAKREDSDQGEISWSKNLRIGFLQQSPEFHPDDNVLSALLGSHDQHAEYEIIARADELISRLGLEGEQISRESKISSLSGGWKKKVALARELMQRPGLLLLDEPTNHLDVESILWLENFLNEEKELAVITVTHDRLFLQNVCNLIFDLDATYKDGLLKIQGGYDDYLQARSVLLEGQKSQEATRSNTLRREVEWLRRGAKARQTKQKARIEKAHDLMDEVADLRERNRDRRIDLDIAGAGRSPRKLIEVENISKKFAGRTLFQNVTLTITPKTRLGLLGRNGCGKSTLIRTLLGDVKPDTGFVKASEQLNVNYFEQHRESLNPKDTVLRAICPDGDYVHLRGEPIFARSYLDRFRFRREQHEMPVEKLSGGEQSRLLIARLMLSSANVLVLDEPTNDLDINTLDTLKEALDYYEGALILVTHDRYFMDQVCETILAFPEPEDLLPGEKTENLISFAGYLQWQDWRTERRANQIKHTRSRQSEADSGVSRKRKLSYKDQRELDGMEANILTQEEELGKIHAELNNPDLQSNHLRLNELTVLAQTQQERIDQLYIRWSELVEMAQK